MSSQLGEAMSETQVFAVKAMEHTPTEKYSSTTAAAITTTIIIILLKLWRNVKIYIWVNREYIGLFSKGKYCCIL